MTEKHMFTRSADAALRRMTLCQALPNGNARTQSLVPLDDVRICMRADAVDLTIN